ncbi:ABC-2 type transporter [Parelaphostrongylus tenuis]|uniref:ABC-2 type transporter n=1 Tax=Parelaphostrongylus tenuis TaxID=148309 RepID=A0AAD5RAA0_PARTN|nr:ABC-2 type transporter [Parelaphostrongylus tenuis]
MAKRHDDYKTNHNKNNTVNISLRTYVHLNVRIPTGLLIRNYPFQSRRVISTMRSQKLNLCTRREDADRGCVEGHSNYGHIFKILALSLITGSVYFQVEFTKDSLVKYKGSAMRASLDMVFIVLYPCICVFNDELPVVIREYDTYTYHPTAYFVAINMADVAQYTILPTVYSVIVYLLAGYSKLFVQYFKFNVLNVTVANVAISAAYAAATLFGNKIAGTTFLPLFMSPLIALVSSKPTTCIQEALLAAAVDQVLADTSRSSIVYRP